MSEQWIYTIVYLAWLAGAACFVLGLHRMNSPATGRSGNQLSAAGMVIAVVATLVHEVEIGDPLSEHEGHRVGVGVLKHHDRSARVRTLVMQMHGSEAAAEERVIAVRHGVWV